MSSFYTNVQRIGDAIYYRGYEGGLAVNKKTKFKPTLFVADKDAASSNWTDLAGAKLSPKVFDSMSEAGRYIDQYADVDGFNLCGHTNYVYQFIQERWPGVIEYDPDMINIASWDIEVDTTDGYSTVDAADKAITTIAYKTSKDSRVHLFGQRQYGLYDPNKNELGMDPSLIVYHEFTSEEDMLKGFVNLWASDYPDVTTGWYLKFFDIPYLVNRLYKIIGESWVKKLSPWGKVNKKSVRLTFGDQTAYDILGVATLDYQDVFKKFGYEFGTQESYKLDHIAHVVLGANKISYEEYGSLAMLLQENYQKYCDYNIRDTTLIEQLESTIALLRLAFDMAYRSGVNFQDSLGTTAIWDSILYREYHGRHIAVPIGNFGTSSSDKELPGGFVKVPVPGMYQSTASFDLDGLYPHLMMQYNMSPETYIKDHREITDQTTILQELYKNEIEYSVAANGVCFDKSKRGVVPTIIEGYYAERKAVKIKMKQKEAEYELLEDGEEKRNLKKEIILLNNRQMSVKILLNALYGAFGNAHFKYYLYDIAEAITTSGQLSLQWVAKHLNIYLNKIMSTDNVDYVIYCDTDSVYLDLHSLVIKVLGEDFDRDQQEQFIDQVCEKKLRPVINKAYEQLADRLAVFEQKMNMKRESICDKAIFVAKKRYIMSALNIEGVHYEPPKIKVTGIEAVRSSTPQICRERLKEIFRVMVVEGEGQVQKFIEKFKAEFVNLKAEDVGKTSGTDDIEKYQDKGPGLYKKRTPIHVRGAILYNHHIKEKGLDKKYQSIVSGDKVKFVYLKTPNPIRENVIAFPGILPKELGLHDYIDYDTQFDKVFQKPVENILEVLNWNSEETFTLEDLFA